MSDYELPTGFPTDNDRAAAESLWTMHGPAAEVGRSDDLVQAIARTLADERRRAFNQGAVAGMKLVNQIQAER